MAGKCIYVYVVALKGGPNWDQYDLVLHSIQVVTRSTLTRSLVAMYAQYIVDYTVIP